MAATAENLEAFGVERIEDLPLFGVACSPEETCSLAPPDFTSLGFTSS
jgi:hypothetical protein